MGLLSAPGNLSIWQSTWERQFFHLQFTNCNFCGCNRAKNPKQTHVVPYHFLTEKGFQRFKCQFKNTHILQVKKSHTTHLWHGSWDVNVSKSIALVQREIPLFDGLL